ncbi:MAG: putative zinc-binding peptidase [Bacteroidota bacterium]
MKIYKCAHCGQLVYFENTYCERCGHAFGFEKDTLELITLEKNENNLFHNLKSPEKQYRYCANHQHGVCNWLIPASCNDIYCQACELNQTIPDISSAINIGYWQQIENAKHRLLYSLFRLQLPAVSKGKDSSAGLAFNFLGNTNLQPRILTGHEDGLITINIEEADDVIREQMRRQMGEPYRTLLGHFRHEVGHYYWDRLIRDSKYLESFRNMFGDERLDYATALQNYYNIGGPANWQQNHISVYASSHPWEDWAESWAHYLHMMDTLETAWSFGLDVTPLNIHPSSDLATKMDSDPYLMDNFDEIVKRWLPFTYAMNSINRSMGHTDLYPFVTSPAVIKKLTFIHEVCRTAVEGKQLIQEGQMALNSA